MHFGYSRPPIIWATTARWNGSFRDFGGSTDLVRGLRGRGRRAPDGLTTACGRAVSAPSRGSARIGPDGGRSPEFSLPYALQPPEAPPTVAARCSAACIRLAAQTERHFLQSIGGGMDEHDSGFFDTRRAAEYLGLSHRTLDGYRVSGDGPAFHRFGNRVRYRRPDLDA